MAAGRRMPRMVKEGVRFGRRAASARTVASLSLSLILSLTPQATTLGALSRSRPVALAQNTRTPAMGSQTRVQHAGTLLRVHSVCFHRRMALKGGDEGADAFDAVGDGIRAAALQGLGSSSGTVPRSMDGFTTSPEEQADAAALKVQMRGTPQKKSDSRARAGVLDAFPPVLISKEGRFKYVLIEASDVEGNVKLLVRGDIRVGYHVYCAQPTIEALQAKDVSCRVLGGGRMEHYPKQRLLKIYGFSHSFGIEDKAMTAQVCQAVFPRYTIETSTEGY